MTAYRYQQTHVQWMHNDQSHQSVGPAPEPPDASGWELVERQHSIIKTDHQAFPTVFYTFLWKAPASAYSSVHPFTPDSNSKTQRTRYRNEKEFVVELALPIAYWGINVFERLQMLDGLNERNSSLFTQLEEKTKQFEELGKKSAELVVENSQLARSLDDKNRSIRTIKTEMDRLSSANDKLRKELEETKELNRLLNVELENVQDLCQRYRLEVKAMKEAGERANKAIDNVKELLQGRTPF